jgi:Collagenase and related proteases
MTESHPLPELLSPCGSPEAVGAAIKAGADAVYLGGKHFNARANAKNFDDEELTRVIELCHGAGVRVYVTLNTMLYDRELPDVLRYAGFLYNIGADAVIAADMGFIKLLRQRLPELPGHISTQAAAHNLPALQTLAELGVKRVVAARELPKTELEELCKNSPVEIEVFVHGALCVSCSGQCLLSAVMGGRSGNRGECAQPCRMSYETLVANGRGGKPGYQISLRDLCLAPYIPELIEAGVASLKIEGRMKSPEYVAGVTRIYRALLDGRRKTTATELNELRRLFSRGGFTDAYYRGDGDTLQNMLGVRSERDKAETRSVQHDSVSAVVLRKPLITVVRERTGIDAVYKPQHVKNTVKPMNIGVFRSAEQIAAPDFFDVILLPPDRFERGTANGIAMPPVCFESELPALKRQLSGARATGAEFMLLENIGQLALSNGFRAIGGTRLNIANTAATEFYSHWLEGVILSPELILPQMRDIGFAAKGAVVYGRLPLMALARRLGGGTSALRDRASAVFPVLPTGSRDILYNSVPIYMADKIDALDAAGVVLKLFNFTTETKREVGEIAAAYMKRLPPASNNIRRIK